ELRKRRVVEAGREAREGNRTAQIAAGAEHGRRHPGGLAVSLPHRDDHHRLGWPRSANRGIEGGQYLAAGTAVQRQEIPHSYVIAYGTGAVDPGEAHARLAVA